MSTEENQDETSAFVCESENNFEVEAPAQEVEVKEEQASSETTNTEEDASEKAEDKSEAKDESTDKEEDDSSGDDTTAETETPKKGKGFQKSIDRLTRQREDEKRKNEALEKRIKELEGKDNQDQKAENKEPVEDDFETYDDYLDALDKFDKQEVKPDEKKAETKQDDSTDEEPLTDSQKTALAVTQERVASADKPDDFDEVALNPDLPVTGEMLEALSECDDPAKVMYHLGQNKDLAAEIAAKSGFQQAVAIAKLDVSVVSKPKKPTKITQAPDVIEPVNGTDSQKKSHSEMTFSEFEAEDRARNKQRKSTW